MVRFAITVVFTRPSNQKLLRVFDGGMNPGQ